MAASDDITTVVIHRQVTILTSATTRAVDAARTFAFGGGTAPDAALPAGAPVTLAVTPAGAYTCPPFGST